MDGHGVWFELTLRNLLEDPSEGSVLVEMIELLVNVVAADAGILAEATRAAYNDVDSDFEISVQRAADVRRCQMILRALPDASGGPSGFILCINDVTEPARLRDQLHRRATCDLLTGCHNRASVLQELEHALAGGSRGTAVTFIDLDGFKSVYDRRGHAAGDALLRDIVHCLQASVPADDVVGRFGGDEFILVHPDTSSAEQALELAERLAASLAAAFQPEPPHAAVASVGVAWVTGPARLVDADTVITWADSAMYRSKSRGDGRPVLSHGAIASAVSEPAPA